VIGQREGLKASRRNVKAGGGIQNGTEDIWKEIEEKIKNAITKHKRKILLWKLGRRKWYNKEWRDKKRELRRVLRNTKKGKIEKEEYVQRRRRKWYEEQKKKHEEKEEAKLRSISTEQKVWKYINKYRKKKIRGTSEHIQIDRWTDHFMELLGGTHERVILEIGSEEEEEKRKERIEEIMREELIEVGKSKGQRRKRDRKRSRRYMARRGILEISQ